MTFEEFCSKTGMSEELSKELTETVSALPLASFEEELSMMMGKTAPLNGVLSLMQKLGKDEHGKKMLLSLIHI